MTLAEASQDYYLYIRHEKGVSPTTYKTYKSWLNHFTRWMQANGYPNPNIEDITTPVLKRYLYEISEEGLRPRSIKARFHPVKGLCLFLLNSGVITHNPFTGIKLPKLDAAERVVATDAQITQLLNAVDKIPNPRRLALTRAVLSILVYSGLRRCEVVSLKLEDVNLQDSHLTVRHGKGEKERVVYICRECRDAIKEWLALRERDTKVPYLFTVDRGRRIHFKALYAMLEEVKRLAGMGANKGLLPHGFRHSVGIRLLKGGADLKTIQNFYGHAHLETTADYLRTFDHQQEKVAHLQSLKGKGSGFGETPF